MHTVHLPGSRSRFVVRGVGRARRSLQDRRWRALALLLALGLAGLADASHTVAPGDNLWTIARRNSTTVEAITRANGIADPSRIFPGQVLRIPGASGPATPVPAAEPVRSIVEHRVEPGQNLSRIAERYGVSVADLAAVNGIRNPNLIRIGQVLKVPVAAPPTIEQLLERYGAEFGVHPALVKAVAWQESGWNQTVVSSAGAIGVMQVIPETGRFAAERLLGHDVDLTQVDHNVKAGVRFLAYLLDATGGDESMALAGYYQGLRSVRTIGVTEQTRRYVANVLALRRRFGGA